MASRPIGAAVDLVTPHDEPVTFLFGGHYGASGRVRFDVVLARLVLASLSLLLLLYISILTFFFVSVLFFFLNRKS